MPPDPDNIGTVAMATAPPSATKPSPARFAPGTLLASRYRIVSRLGKGGMGEVFRADDLVLGQSVALKFLPEAARGNENLLARSYEEVRITRQISHPNVCRVYDIGEAGGQPFLSMEYIDGEDLSSLLRRIGRGRSAIPGEAVTSISGHGVIVTLEETLQMVLLSSYALEKATSDKIIGADRVTCTQYLPGNRQPYSHLPVRRWWPLRASFPSVRA
jgi:hypothetical protein